jgi:flavin-dependent dehydrogenase
MAGLLLPLSLFGATAVLSLLSSRVVIDKKARTVRDDEVYPLPPSEQSQSGKGNEQSRYDALIVGAGPAGSTTAFYLGKLGYRVALCDRKKFPRQKVCGDAWCKPALDILEDMGALKKMEADGICHVVKRGGLVSPFGYECINTDGDAYGSVTGCKTYAIKRQIADEYLVRAAEKQSSVELMEETEIVDAVFVQYDQSSKREIEVPIMSSTGAGYWRVQLSKNGTRIQLEANMLLICDGTTSYLGQKLGVIPKGSQPEAVCSHSYVKSGTHSWADADGVMIFTRSVLPGYSALFRHYNGDVYFGTYILPGGKATATAIAPFETEALVSHPYVQSAIGD